MIAVILVGGEGTRLRPLTLDRPKAILPIAGRPFLAHLLDALTAAGVSRVIFSCGYLPDPIVTALGAGGSGWPRLQYVLEDEPLGTAGGIRHAAFGRIDETFLALNGDVLAAFDFRAAVRLHEARRARATLTLTAVDDPTRYGLVLRDERDRVTAFLEKPSLEEAGAAPYWINAGSYVLEPAVLELIPPGRPVSIEREVFPLLVGDGLAGYGAAGYWNDIGTPESYMRGNIAVLEGALGAPLAELAPDAEVAAGATLVAPYSIGAGARIASGARIGPAAVVGAGAFVDEGAVIERGILHEGAHIGARAQVVDAVVGRGAVVGADARVDEATMIGAGVEVAPGARLRGERLAREENDDT